LQNAYIASIRYFPPQRTDKPYSLDMCLLIPEEAKLLDGDLESVVVAMVDVSEGPSMAGVADWADVHTLDEQRCREDVCIGRKLDQEIKGMAIELIGESEFV
jgi:hypothetical protein